MTLLPRSTWRYAILIIALFGIAALAASKTMSFLANELDLLEQNSKPEIVRNVTLAVWLLTFGFMFMAGALGLWGIRTSVEIESRRRIAKLVDVMDYFTDGMIMVNPNGTILAANPAAHSLALQAIAKQACFLRDIFPVLTDLDVSNLLKETATHEIEREADYPPGRRTLRFRSQHSSGNHFIIVSDVTDVKTEELRKRQAAQLHLLGRIAAGVAHDFNNILCAVAGHAALIERLSDDPKAMRQSLDFILAEAERGSHLSRHLIELSRSGASEPVSNAIDANVEEAATLLRIALSPAWSVSTTIEGRFPSVPLAPQQIEQLVLNLGLLAADAQPRPGSVTITLSRPGEGHLTDVGSRYTAVIVVSAESKAPTEPVVDADALPFVAGEIATDNVQTSKTAREYALLPSADEAGVIPSVLRTLVEEVGGCLDYFGKPGALSIYRVCLPRRDQSVFPLDLGGLGGSLRESLQGARVLVALPKPSSHILEQVLQPVGANLLRHNDALAVLSVLGDDFAGKDDPSLRIVALHTNALGNNPVAIMKAMARLAPDAAFVVMGGSQSAYPGADGLPLVFTPETPTSIELADLLIEAAKLAATLRQNKLNAQRNSMSGTAVSNLPSN